MKIAILIMTLTFSMKAYSSDCLELYDKTSLERQDRADRSAAGAGIYTVVSMLVIPVTALGGPVLVGTLGLTSITATVGFVAGKMLSSYKLTRALKLLDPESRPFKRLYKRAKRRRPQLTEIELLELLEVGFHSGKFCSEAPYLYGVRQIRHYVLEMGDPAVTNPQYH